MNDRNKSESHCSFKFVFNKKKNKNTTKSMTTKVTTKATQNVKMRRRCKDRIGALWHVLK